MSKTAKQYKKLKENKSSKLYSILTLKESVFVTIKGEKVLLEKGEKVRVLKESYDWDDIVDTANKEGLNPKVKGIINFIDKNRDKYKSDIKNFVDWWNDELDDADLDVIETLIKQNPPSETGFDNLPSDDWKYYLKFA